MKTKILIYSVLLPLGLLAVSFAPKFSTVKLTCPRISVEKLKEGHKLVVEVGASALAFVSQIR